MNTHTLIMRVSAILALALPVVALAGCMAATAPVVEPPTLAPVPPVSHVVEPPTLPAVTLPALPPVETVRTETVYVETPGATETVYVETSDPAAYDSGLSVGWDQGYHDGYADGYRPGYEDGRVEGEDWILSALQRPCETEDSDMCYWNAAVQGNGEGRSFVSVYGTAYYLD